MATIQINSIRCILNDEVDKDEVFLKYAGNKIWPGGFFHPIDSGERTGVNVQVEHPDTDVPFKIELWDFDFLSKDDLIGTFTMKVEDEKGGPYETSMQLKDMDSTASYILEWEIL